MINKLWCHLQKEQVQLFLDDQPDSILSNVFAALDNEFYWSDQPPFAKYQWHYEHAEMTLAGWLNAIELFGGDATKANDELRLLFLEAATERIELAKEQERSFTVLQWTHEHNQVIEMEAKSA